MGIGDRVRELREARGWTQQELADRAGVTQGWISKLEGGSRGKKGYADQISRVADALGVSSDWLITGEGPRERVSSERTVELDGEIDPMIARVAEGRGYSERVLRQASVGRGAYGTSFTEENAMELLEITARYEREVVRSARLAELEAATERAPLPKVRVGTGLQVRHVVVADLINVQAVHTPDPTDPSRPHPKSSLKPRGVVKRATNLAYAG